jgi:lysophospholipase L1-like esterase
MAPCNHVIVALGDSTTAGTPGWQSPLEAPPHGHGDEQSQYAYWIMHAHPAWRVLNRGVDGERSDQILDRFDRDVVNATPAAVVIIAGVNDVYQGRPASEVIANLSRMYQRAKEAGISVVAGTIVPYNTATPAQNAAMREINDWIRATGDSDVLVADTRAAVAALDNPDRLASSPDNLHPSVEGYRRMGEAIARVLARLSALGPRL